MIQYPILTNIDIAKRYFDQCFDYCYFTDSSVVLCYCGSSTGFRAFDNKDRMMHDKTIIICHICGTDNMNAIIKQQ